MRGGRRRSGRENRRVVVGLAVATIALVATLLTSDLTGVFPVLSLSQAPPAANGITLVAGTGLVSAPRRLSPAGPGRVQLAMLPPMGWNGYNHFRLNVTAATVEAAARALVSSNMAAAGYTYVNLDGGWNLPSRNAFGLLQPDPRKFPKGIQPVATYVHSLGLKFGIYVSAGTRNCAGTSAGSFGHYGRDASSFASWGVDYVKLDWCDVPYTVFGGLSHANVSRILAAQMAAAIAATHRPILLDVNDWTEDKPWMWAGGTAHMWRTTPDIQDRYQSMVLNFTRNVARFSQAAPGGWNDPDMLEVGNGGMSPREDTSMFSLWAEMAAPLIAGNDLTTMSVATAAILTNAAVIAVDQDPLGRQGYPVSDLAGHWVLTKPLQFGDRAVVLFNEANTPALISTTVEQVGMPRGSEYSLVDLWSGAATLTLRDIGATVPPHGVVMYRVSVAAEPAGGWS